MPTYHEALRINEQYAIDNGKEATAIKILLLHFSHTDSARLLGSMHETMPQKDYEKFLAAVDAYVIHSKPVQHITEEESFLGHKFKVNHTVMIPRCETEELAEKTLELIAQLFTDKTALRVLDIGTGSGCLAIALSLEDKRIHAFGTEISHEALQVAAENSEALGAGVTFKQGNLTEPVQGEKFDIIVSNPPYIPDDEKLEPIVKDYEPHLALFGGTDGLDYYRAILKQIPNLINDRFLIGFEHAYDKAKQLKKLIKKEMRNVKIVQLKDMQGKDRMTFITNKE